MVTGAKRLNFPKPGATKEKEQITMINAERMLIHYNQDHPELKSPAKPQKSHSTPASRLWMRDGQEPLSLKTRSPATHRE